jgi:hypothetical protein
LINFFIFLFFKLVYGCLAIKRGEGVRLLSLPNVQGVTFILGGTSIQGQLQEWTKHCLTAVLKI